MDFQNYGPQINLIDPFIYILLRNSINFVNVDYSFTLSLFKSPRINLRQDFIIFLLFFHTISFITKTNGCYCFNLKTHQFQINGFNKYQECFVKKDCYQTLVLIKMNLTVIFENCFNEFQTRYNGLLTQNSPHNFYFSINLWYDFRDSYNLVWAQKSYTLD